MQVDCSKCAQPIALTDNVESIDGRLSHVECKRTQVLTPEEGALILAYCENHVVARCLPCGRKYCFTELASGLLFGSRMNACPRCWLDLTEQVRAHLFRCTMLPSEVRLRARAVREAAQHLVKQSQELRDEADALIREAEAGLFDSQRLLREAMSRREAS